MRIAERGVRNKNMRRWRIHFHEQPHPMNSASTTHRSPLTLPQSAIRNLQSAILLSVFLTGCAGYQVGNRTLYSPDIRTVYVPMFESNSFRRGLGERLTEAVVKEIELKTPYKVVGSPDADSVLSGTIISETKRITAETPFDDPRTSELNLVVQVTWVDRRGDIMQEGCIPLPPAVVEVEQSAKVTPEVGQSIAVGHQVAIQKLAEQIVGLMEMPW
jgi:hypothetical protein